ncbi:MAG: penicillin-binding protein 2 [Gammaproteobacteria bacterium RIFCSPHIGHO2_12_FULL_35_23]|nr:MAG: penicillin-binding protein 2 [Gammaproteobacteria bacterium RIFCSPHIGHO2_12_FULL_35_23]
MFKYKTSIILKNQIKELLLFKHRLLAVIIIIIILSSWLIARMFYLQVIQHSYYTTLSKQNAIGLLPLPPARGLIYDRNGVLLARNIPVYSLMVIPDKVSNLTKELIQIQKIIPLSAAELQVFHRQIKQHLDFQEVPLKLKLSAKQVAEFAVENYRFPGFEVKAELIRQYPFKKMFSHVIGYVGRINAAELNQVNLSNYAETNYYGKTGIENYYETTLHGNVGYQRVETDASGQIVRILKTIPSVAGSNIYLTIDSKLQAATQAAMQGYNGAAIVIQPKTGQVLAMVSLPVFNPNQFVKGISSKAYAKLLNDPNRPLYNRATHGLYAIGSTIKPFIGLEALATGTVTPAYQIYDPGWYKIPGSTHVFHDWQKGGHGIVNLHKAIMVSCDTFFYTVAYNLGITPIDHVLTEFGFGQLTGINFPNELAGTVPSPAYKRQVTGQSWYTGDTVNTVIGQGYYQATVIQLANAAAALANRGVRYRPTLLYAIQPVGKSLILQPKQSLPRADITDKQIWYEIISAMQDVIKQGTAYNFGPTPYTVAAKTGTAQVRNNPNQVTTGLTKNELSNSIFIAFAPVKKPQIAVAVIIEHSPHTAVKVARQIMDYYLITENHWHPKANSSPSNTTTKTS